MSETKGISREIFAEAFRENVRRRSRSAGGVDGNTKSGSTKRPMLLSGDDLAVQVARNVEALIEDVLETPLWETLTAAGMKARCERWYDISTDGLIDYTAYGEDFDRICADMELMNTNFGSGFTFNRRYRLWTPEYYTVVDIPPFLIDHFMERFYREYVKRMGGRLVYRSKEESILAAYGERQPDRSVGVELMAFVNVMMDGVIHPWLDACSRVSTALLMWTALHLEDPPPLYHPDKKVHVSTITDLAKHAAYLEESVERFLAWEADR